MPALIWTSAACALVLAVFGIFAVKLASRTGRSECTPEWLEGFSPESYRPMERLLNEKDFEFLASQPGYRPVIAAKLRKERRRLFRAYLRELTRDFNKLAYVASVMIVYASEDRSDLAREVSALRRQFYLRIAMAEFTLLLYPVLARPVDSSPLIRSLESMGNNTRILISEQGSAA